MVNVSEKADALSFQSSSEFKVGYKKTNYIKEQNTFNPLLSLSAKKQKWNIKWIMIFQSSSEFK